MHSYSTNPQARHTSDDADLKNLFDGPERELTQADKALIDSICAGLEEFVAELSADPEVAQDLPVPANDDQPDSPTPSNVMLLAGIAAWRERNRAFNDRQRAQRAQLKPVRPAKAVSLDPKPPVDPSNYNAVFGVSHRTVTRRRKAGVTGNDLFQATRGLEHMGKRYSGTEFAKVFKISKRRVLEGMNAGMTGAEILESRRSNGRPRF